MTWINVKGHRLETAAFVFDKDGLLFKSKDFWIALAEERLIQIRQLNCAELTMEWAKCFGVNTEDGVVVKDVDASGILAVASPTEEIVATACLIVSYLDVRWTEARDIANDIFYQADMNLSLDKALKPRQGFPQIMKRLRDNNIPYGIATSDTEQRVLDSFEIFDNPEFLSFIISPKDVENGKPNPDMLEEISRRMDIPINLLAMVGDSYVDMEMAKRAGAIGIGIPETEEMKHQMQELGAIVLENLDQIQFER